MKNSKGFTLVELVVVIAILGILAGIAIPRFMEATRTARGAKIVADMRTMESAVYVFYVKYGHYPTSAEGASNGSLSLLIQGGWPVPPQGEAIITYTDSNGNTGANEFNANGMSYSYDDEAATDSSAKGFIKIGDKTVVDLITTSGTPSPSSSN